jgi:hypothetical protein
MFEEWVEFDDFPGAKVLLQPFDLEHSFIFSSKSQAVASDPALIGGLIQEVLRYSVRDWKNAPLQRNGSVAETFDPKSIRWLNMDFATQVYRKAFVLSSGTEEETKNSESQST